MDLNPRHLEPKMDLNPRPLEPKTQEPWNPKKPKLKPILGSLETLEQSHTFTTSANFKQPKS